MPGFRDKRIILLVVMVLGSALAVLAMGPNWGIDIKGGSRIMLRTEATHVTIKVSNYNEPDVDNHVGDILTNLRENLNANVTVLPQENYLEDGRLKVEIGKRVDKGTIASLLKEGDNILEGSYSTDVKPRQQEELIDALRRRVDPSGTLGAQFKPVGKQYIRFEVPLGLEKAETLLGEVGRLEIFIEENLVLKGNQIQNVQSPRYSSRRGTYEIPFTLTDKGARDFADASENREGYPGVIYLDRPAGSIILYQEGFEETLKSDAEVDPRLTDAGYNRMGKYRFYLKTTESTDRQTGEVYPPHWFPVMVKAFKTKEEEVPENTRNYLLNNLNRVTKVIYLGKRSELSDELIQGDNFVVDNNRIPFENFQRREELATKWLMRVVGIESFPTLMSGVTGSVKNARDGLVITTGGGQSEAQNLRTILSQSLPLQVSIVSKEKLSARLGSSALKEVFQAGLAALIAVGALVYYRYRKFKIVLPLILTMLCEVEITLGLSSIIPPGLLTLGLPEIGGLVAVVGTGVDHQIIITDEVLSGGISEGGHTPFSRRSDRAFSIIFAAAATTVAAMLALAFVGLGQMRGFAIITIIGVLISVLITRPAYAKVIGTLLEREQS